MQDKKAVAFLTPAQVADRYSVGVGRVIDWIKRGELRGVNVSSSLRSRKPQYRIPVEAVETFEQARTTRPRPATRPAKRSDCPNLV